ncbi:MAG: hypothetical protein WD250_17185 [Egibacteraceae bacterium]
MSRRRTAVPRPTPDRAAAIPDVAAADLGRLSRVCDARHDSPWHFSCRNERERQAGRLDLAGGRGSCYWNDDDLGALHERLTDPDDLDALVPASLLDRLRVWQHTPPPPESAADTTARDGGLPKEFGAGTHDERYWAWADLLDAEGRDAVRTWSRMAPHGARNVTVFGDAGPATHLPDDGWNPASDWGDELAGIGLVEPHPRLEDLDITADGS